MKAKKIRQKDAELLGYSKGELAALAINTLRQHFKKEPWQWQEAMLKNVLAKPMKFFDDPRWQPLVAKLGEQGQLETPYAIPALRREALPYTSFGNDATIDHATRQQLYNALRLPIAVAGALMPDAHLGYGLPIGGVLATKNAVIPYGVGVDIGCRMCLSVFDLPGSLANSDQARLKNLLLSHTAFGEGGVDRPMEDAVLEDPTFGWLPEAKRLREKAARQIGSSGSGNHFVEFGVAELPANNQWGLAAGAYLALLSHSGSRGLGASLANYYTKVAMQQTRLPKQLAQLAWLGMDTDAGRAYWAAMQLSGRYAAACHDHIHRRLGKALGEQALFRVENHHNFAWEEKLADGSSVIVHRKGATPAKLGELGIIPGSMTAPGYIVAGRGNFASLQSASHGAGRALSRSQAKNSTTRHALEKELDSAGVQLIGGGLDEAPIAYKDIRLVMQQQTELVDILGTFQPKVVRMA